MADPNSDFRKWWDPVHQSMSYLQDPDISEHDKDLQYALDYPLSDPVETEKAFREELAILTSRDPYIGLAQHEYHGYESLEEVKAELEELLSPENLEEARAEYAKHLALVNEALSKGFVKGGNCGNVR